MISLYALPFTRTLLEPALKSATWEFQLCEPVEVWLICEFSRRCCFRNNVRVFFSATNVETRLESEHDEICEIKDELFYNNRVQGVFPAIFTTLRVKYLHHELKPQQVMWRLWRNLFSDRICFAQHKQCLITVSIFLDWHRRSPNSISAVVRNRWHAGSSIWKL